MGGAWSVILKMGLDMSLEEHIFFTELRIGLGNGAKTRFWGDQ